MEQRGMEERLKTERREKKIIPPKQPEPEKKGYRKWAKYIIAGVFIILFFILLRGKKEKVEIPGPEIVKPPAHAATENTETTETMTAPAPAALPETSPLFKKNTSPEIVSIKLIPKLVYPGAKIKAKVEGSDKDGDDITFYYEWKKDGIILPGSTTDELDTTGFKKGELVTLYVTPFDGKEKGKTRWSPTIMITNRPPEITSFPPVILSDGKFIYEVKANDPDGDMLAYSLEGAPPGMTIDSATGIIQWDVPKATDVELPPTYNIRIVVSDGDAVAFQGFTINQQIEVK